MCSGQVVDTGTISFKLAAGVAGYLGIKPWIVRDSWKLVGLYPMDYRFLDKIKNHEEDLKSVAMLQQKSGPTEETTAIVFGQDTLSKDKCTMSSVEHITNMFCSLQIACKELGVRTPDAAVGKRVMSIVNNEKENPPKMLQLIAQELSKHTTTNDILMSVGPRRTEKPVEKGEVHRLPKRNSGAGAVYVASAT